MKTLLLACQLVTTHVGTDQDGRQIYQRIPECVEMKALPWANVFHQVDQIKKLRAAENRLRRAQATRGKP